MRFFKRAFIALMLALCITITGVPFMPKTGTQTVQAKTKIKLNKKKLTVDKYAFFSLKLQGVSGKVKWSTSNKKVVSIDETKKNKATFYSESSGTATITAKFEGKKYKCKVTVKGEKDESSSEGMTYESLREYIRKNGVINSNGNRVINYAENYGGDSWTAAIVCDDDNDLLQFIYINETEVGKNLFVMDWDSAKKAPIIFQSLRYEDLAMIKGEAIVYVPTYSLETLLDFSFSYNDYIIEDAQAISNSCARAAMIGWQVLLLEKTKFGLKDIGFSKFVLE